MFLLKLVKSIYHLIKKMFIYIPYKPEEYWRKRAKEKGLKAVMWENNFYNFLASKKEKEKINQYFKNIENKRILDLCCGVGRISKYLAKKGALVVGVDLEEMIERAKKENSHPNIEYIKQSIHELNFPENNFDFILSLGGISSCCDTKQKIEKIFLTCYKSLKFNGLMICIDPFHKWAFLARPARFSIGEIIKIAEKNNFKIIEKSGILFWPLRVYLTSRFAPKSKKITKLLFEIGEKFLFFSPVFLSDYKILVFKK